VRPLKFSSASSFRFAYGRNRVAQKRTLGLFRKWSTIELRRLSRIFAIASSWTMRANPWVGRSSFAADRETALNLQLDSAAAAENAIGRLRP